MAGRAVARLSRNRAQRLSERFSALQQNAIPGPDPIDFVHRYTNPDDQEVAAIIASSLAFGRVASFYTVLDVIFSQADARGGPATWAEQFTHSDARTLAPVFYRWTRGNDLARFIETIGRIRRLHGSVGCLFEKSHQSSDPDLGDALGLVITEFRNASLTDSHSQFAALPQGYRYLLPHPSSGSACKRWCMLLRWMVRTEAPDVGLWKLPSHKLIIPLDTHIHRIARFVGLTHRTDGSWRTAQEITRNLKKIDPADPVRFDFALAHLGISGACKGRRIASICDPCGLLDVCKTGQVG